MLGAVLLSGAWLSGCADKEAPLMATLTFKRDGSHFAGTVIRRDPNAITITNSAGEAHTFLYSELSDIKYGTPDPVTDFSAATPAPAKAPAADKPGSAGTAPASGAIRFPEGTELPVTNNGVLDACCLPIGAIALGNFDADVKSADGKVLIPEGANVTILVRDKKMVDGRVTIQFELGSADFYNRHYLISSAVSELDPGAVVTFSGAQDGSPEAKLRGLWVHLYDHTHMAFKTATPTVFKLSQ